MNLLESVIIVIAPLISTTIAIGFDYHLWKKSEEKRESKKKEESKEEKIGRYYPNLNFIKFTGFIGVFLAILYLIIRLMPYLLKESPTWPDVTLRFGILAFVVTILVILAKTIRED